MKKQFLTIVVALVLTSCGKALPVPKEPELERYALEFEQEMGVSTDYISLKFTDLTGYEMGLCTRWTDGRRHIDIDKEYWDKQSDLGKEQLMYHELGHCALNLDHDEKTVYDPNTYWNIPESIMYPYYFGDSYEWSQYKDAYKRALRANTGIVIVTR